MPPTIAQLPFFTSGRYPKPDLIGRCGDFVEAIGEVGDVYLLHPFILHAKAQNVLRVPRYITNPPVNLVEPMRFDRPDPADFSLVERAVLRGLGVDRYSFTAQGPREQVVPERVAMQRTMKQAELDRLSAEIEEQLLGLRVQRRQLGDGAADGPQPSRGRDRHVGDPRG